jgi:hypothetical protein
MAGEDVVLPARESVTQPVGDAKSFAFKGAMGVESLLLSPSPDVRALIVP